jgi:hypothetical protein
MSTPEVRWAVVWRAATMHGDSWKDLWSHLGAWKNKSERKLYELRDEALQRLDIERGRALPNYRCKIRLVKITRKPRLSPEVKAARDALCAAAVGYAKAGSVLKTCEVVELNKAAYAYWMAVRR